MKKDGARKHIRETPLAEWIAAGVGVVLILFTLTTLLYQAFSNDDTPADLVVEIEDITPADAGYRVRFKVRNNGTRAAASIRISGELKREGRITESVDALLDYVAAESTASGALQFQHDPRNGELTIRAESYQDA